MGFIAMNKDLGDMTKATISFWFRVPGESISKSVTESNPGFYFYRVLWGVIPLITWGSQDRVPEVGVTKVLPPSSIGVRTGVEGVDYNPPGNPSLDVHIQTESLSRAYITGDEADVGNNAPVYCGNSEMEGIWDDPETGDLDSIIGHPAVLVDHWNHVILSWELGRQAVSPGGAVDSASKMWCSINDVNIAGDKLPAMRLTPMGANDHVSGFDCFFVVHQEQPDMRAEVDIEVVPSYPLCVPGPAGILRNDAHGEIIGDGCPIYKVEMAELQIFVGKTLDTGDTANRRAFVDVDGYPVSPIATVDADGNRIPPPAERLLGKRPEVLLTGASDWAEGANTGSLGLMFTDEGPIKIPDGQFVPFGNILSWSPDPSLHGPQNPPPPPPAVRLMKKPNLVGTS